jgi:GTP-binding protein EngB required for normal cell division
MDIACAQWLHKEKVPYLVVFTKADKRSKGDSTVQNVQACLDLLVQVTGAVPDAFLTSAVEGSGGRDVLQHLAERQACWAEERDA